jgi:hypothetical protein
MSSSGDGEPIVGSAVANRCAVAVKCSESGIALEVIANEHLSMPVGSAAGWWQRSGRFFVPKTPSHVPHPLA